MGGAVFTMGAFTSGGTAQGTVTISYSTFTGNSATGGAGGSGGGGSGGGGYGGALFNLDGSVTLINDTLTGNSVTGGAAGGGAGSSAGPTGGTDVFNLSFGKNIGTGAPASGTLTQITVASQIVSSPVAAVSAAGNAAPVEAFAVDAGHNLWEQTQAAAGGAFSPHGWIQVGFGVKSVAAVNVGGGQVEVFAVDTAGTLWEQTQTAAGGTLTPLSPKGWTAIGSGVKSVAAVNAGGRVEVFAVDTAGTLWEQDQTAAGGSLSPLSPKNWTAIGSGITAVVATLGPGGAALVFAVDTAGTLWEQTQQTAAGGTLSPLSTKGWVPIGSGVTSVAATEGPGGAVEVFATDFAGTLWEQTQPAGGGPFTPKGWSAIGSGVKFVTAAEDFFTGTPQVFAVDTAGTLWEQTQQAAGGSTAAPYSPHGWTAIGSGVTFVDTATNGSGAAEVFALDFAGTLWEQTEPTSAGGAAAPYSPKGWTAIGSGIEQPAPPGSGR
jgi:hypothetical protein